MAEALLGVLLGMGGGGGNGAQGAGDNELGQHSHGFSPCECRSNTSYYFSHLLRLSYVALRQDDNRKA